MKGLTTPEARTILHRQRKRRLFALLYTSILHGGGSQNVDANAETPLSL